MGGQLGRIPRIPGYLVFRTQLSIPDTVSGILCMGGQLGRIPSIPGYLCEGVCMGAQLGRIPTLCV